MDHNEPPELKLGEAAHRFGDPAIVEALAAAEAEAARMETLDGGFAPLDLKQSSAKLVAYYEVDHQRWQLVADIRQRLLRGELVATARERPTGPRIAVIAEAWMHLHPRFFDNTARDGMDAITLYDVRVAMAGSAPVHSACVPAATAIPDPADGEPCPVYSEAALRYWFTLRTRTWPKAYLPPSEADDIAAASAYFGKPIPRDPFRVIRRDLAPVSWKKPGPRKPRK